MNTKKLMTTAAVCAAALSPTLAGDWTDNQDNEYTALAAIKNTGGQWIVSDITPSSTDIVRTKFKSYDTANNNTIWCARPAKISPLSQAFSGFFLKTYFRIDRSDKSSPSKSGGPNPGTDDCYVEANYGTGAYSVKGDSGTMTSIDDPSYTVGSPLMFFASNATGTQITENMTSVGNNGACAIYWFQLYDSSTNLIHNKRRAPSRARAGSGPALARTT